MDRDIHGEVQGTGDKPAGSDSPVVDWRWTETAGEFFPLSEISEISESAFDDCAGLFLITTEETSLELFDAARSEGMIIVTTEE